MYIFVKIMIEKGMPTKELRNETEGMGSIAPLTKEKRRVFEQLGLKKK